MMMPPSLKNCLSLSFQVVSWWFASSDESSVLSSTSTGTITNAESFTFANTFATSFFVSGVKFSCQL